MRRADYLALAQSMRLEVDRVMHAWYETEPERVAARDSVERLARDFARRAHLGGMKPADFLTLANVRA